MTNVIEIDQPKCSRCGKSKPIDELNGYDPLATVGQKFKNAYCRQLLECDSQSSLDLIKFVKEHL